MKITMKAFDYNDDLLTRSRKCESKSSWPTLTTVKTTIDRQVSCRFYLRNRS